MIYQIITEDRRVITVDEKIYSNADLTIPLAPSDTVRNFVDFLETNRKEWGFARDVFIDSADQATITELNKHKRLHGSAHNFIPAYKKTTIIDRILLQISWLQQDAYLVLDHCVTISQNLNVTAGKRTRTMNQRTETTTRSMPVSMHGCHTRCK